MQLRELVIATGNRGKLAELRALLADSGIEVRSQADFAVPEVAETGLSFVENAILKARHAAARTGLPALADDSGLEVDALAGEPGVHSARYAGEPSDDAANNRKLLAALVDVPEARRTARFHCVLALLRHPADPVPLICAGRWGGRILQAPAGQNGFGYDPLFLVEAEGCSAAELPRELKNRLSHRAQALRQLLLALGKPC
ncbi:MAG: RdgB/HAM1 family non-canonical purine NTP pyrophosphatase [Pseudomonadales bacterium]|nr:RdgB/HAM1 family non-canonical purine NTP pyrophosphatase [Pseudomonadales bacterium]